MSQIAVSEKNTKSEILRAYEELLQQAKEASQPSKKVEKELQEKKETVKSASVYSSDKIISGLASLKMEVMKSLDGLAEQLLEQQKKFTILQNAIEIETKELAELYEIRAESDSLAALLLGNKVKKTEFEQSISQSRALFDDEMTEKRQAWKRQQDQLEQQSKETQEKSQKERLRENEEYQYKLKLERQKDADQYAFKKLALDNELTEKKTVFEKSCAEREASIKAREAELFDLREKVTSFPVTLETSVKEVEKNTAERLQSKYQYEANLKIKETEGETKLLKQMITTLDMKIKEKDGLIEQLTQKSNQATLQIQDIAVKAIEGASMSRNFQNLFSRQTETDKLNKGN